MRNLFRVAALVYLPRRVDTGEERRRCLEQRGGEPREQIERRTRRRIEQAARGDLAQAVRCASACAGAPVGASAVSRP
jgi:hypothetical protein